MAITALTCQMKGVINALVEYGQTVEQAAARQRIHTGTVRAWLTDPTFRGELKARRLQLLKAVARERQTAQREALADMGGDLAGELP